MFIPVNHLMLAYRILGRVLAGGVRSLILPAGPPRAGKGMGLQWRKQEDKETRPSESLFLQPLWGLSILCTDSQQDPYGVGGQGKEMHLWDHI